MSKKTKEKFKPDEAVRLNELSAKMVRQFIDGSDNAKDSEEIFLRVKIQGGGCAGFQYQLALDSSSEKDFVFSSHGETIVVDPESFEFIKGAEVTYTDGINGSGFEVLNPRAKSACGCGSSFTIDDEGCDQTVY